MKRIFSIVLALATCLIVAPRLQAQAEDGAAGSGQSKPGAASPSSANPFPEDSSDVPVMPSKTTPDLFNKIGETENPPLPAPGKDLDPVRSPDDPVPAVDNTQGDTWSSSLQGMDKILPQAEDDQARKKREPAPVKKPTHQEAASKDLEVGRFYLQNKNWKAAFSRFESALVLDPENPEVYWGLAEAERHLGEFAKARADYQKLLDYDPDGPHGKQARKALEDPALLAGQPANGTPK
jgi:hypothetical protein